MRLKPRYNAEVNQWWMCDAGRYGYKFIDKERLLSPQKKEGIIFKEGSWDEILEALAKRIELFLQKNKKSALGVCLSPQLANEDLAVAKKFFEETLGVSTIALLSPFPKGDEDDFLIKSDKNPNTQGALALGVSKVSFEEMVKGIEGGKVKGLYLFGQDFVTLVGAGKGKELLGKLEFVIFEGSNENRTTPLAHYVLPAAVYAEKNGTFTNHTGRVQRFSKALEPLGNSLPDAEILQRLTGMLS